jgi:hypothetical protein
MPLFIITPIASGVVIFIPFTIFAVISNLINGEYYDYIDEIGYYGEDGEWYEYDYATGYWGDDEQWHENEPDTEEQSTTQQESVAINAALAKSPKNDTDHFLWVSEEGMESETTIPDDQVPSSELTHSLVIEQASSCSTEEAPKTNSHPKMHPDILDEDIKGPEFVVEPNQLQPEVVDSTHNQQEIYQHQKQDKPSREVSSDKEKKQEKEEKEKNDVSPDKEEKQEEVKNGEKTVLSPPTVVLMDTENEDSTDKPKGGRWGAVLKQRKAEILELVRHI